MSESRRAYMDRFMKHGPDLLSDPHVRKFIDEPRVGVVAWAAPSGGLRSTPVWYHFEDGVFWLLTEDRAAKAQAVRRNPDVSFTIDERGGSAPCALTVHGRAEVVGVDEALAQRFITRYVGPEGAKGYLDFCNRRMGSVLIRIVPERAVWVDLSPLVSEMVGA